MKSPGASRDKRTRILILLRPYEGARIQLLHLPNKSTKTARKPLALHGDEWQAGARSGGKVLLGF